MPWSDVYSINWEYQGPEAVREFYTIIARQVCSYYHAMLPEVFDQPFKIRFVESVAGASYDSRGLATAYDAQITVDEQPSNFTLPGDIDCVSHELAHLVLIRKVGPIQFGKYVASNKDGVNLVHFAFNDHYNGKQYKLIHRRQKASKKYLVDAFLLTSPHFSIPVVEVRELYRIIPVIQQIIDHNLPPLENPYPYSRPAASN